MELTRRGTLLMMAAAVPVLAGVPALAADLTVQVSLWDKGGNAMDKLGDIKPMGYEMPGMVNMHKMATMGITATPDAVPAGRITFEVTNSSKETVHEMIIAPVKGDKVPLPYNKDEMRVEEEKAGHLGEVSELDPGASGALTLTLKPGQYILYCNIPGHYVMGMWTMFTVSA